MEWEIKLLIVTALSFFSLRLSFFLISTLKAMMENDVLFFVDDHCLANTFSVTGR